MAKTFSSPVPVGSRYTSGFSRARKLWGIVRAHAGTDWAPPKPGQHVAIYAVASGTVVSAGVGVLAGHSGQIVVIDHGVLRDSTGADRTMTNYGHLSEILVHRGQKVKAGQKIALMGATGNVTGVHLHLGVRFNGVYSNPKTWLKNKGIVPGKTAPVSQGHVSSTASKPKPRPKPAVTNSKFSQNTKNIQLALKKMGYKIVADGIRGSETIDTIKQYQREQKAPFKLVADGDWGPTTQKHYEWTKKLQRAMNKWKGRNVGVDGHYGSNTVSRVRDIMNRNHGKAYKGRVDSVPGRMFCKMLKISTHP